MTDTISQLARQLEGQRERAMLSGSQAELERLIAEDAAYVHSNGSTQGREAYVDDVAVKRSVVYQRLSLGEVKVCASNASLLVLSGVMDAQIAKAAGTIAVRSVYTAVYEMRESRWLLVRFQATKLQ